ncbi:hypothetical protein NUW58_g2962 [Xylaria curta]|uniref:Uncharacterized protein n=1 Tax=Xylaria curta TaxID=42375 RepID=A0ACC1PDN3_9PEZI|nr:hypothetical protein NUW58_g2962 [Xylaria curta]
MRFLITLAAAVAVSAVPEVTVVPKALTCSNFPFFRQLSSVAGPFSIFAESTGNETIDGNRATYVTISDPTLATAWIQCQAFGAAEMLAVKVDNNYQPLSISKYIYHEYDGLAFVKTVAPGAPIQPHWHYYANGTRQAGSLQKYDAWWVSDNPQLTAVEIRDTSREVLRSGGALARPVDSLTAGHLGLQVKLRVSPIITCSMAPATYGLRSVHTLACIEAKSNNIAL